MTSAIPRLPDAQSERPAWLTEQFGALEREFDDLISGDHPWQTLKETRDLTVKRCKGRHGLDVIRSEFTAPCSAERLSRRIHSHSPYRQHWHHQLDHTRAHTIDTIDADKGQILVREVYKSQLMGLIHARDAVVLAVHDLIPDGRRLMYMSIEHPEYPPVDRIVRAYSRPAGIVMKNTGQPDTCHCIQLDQMDLRLAYLPQSVVDTAAPSLAQLFTKNMLKSAKLPDKDHPPLPGAP